MTIRLHRTAFAGLAASLLSITGMVGLAMAQQTTISFFTGNDEATVAVTEQLVADFEAANPDIKVEIEIGPGGTERGPGYPDLYRHLDQPSSLPQRLLQRPVKRS
jgi:ABC-type glycerol-3-phosphate transport system substrate-binding protein